MSKCKVKNKKRYFKQLPNLVDNLRKEARIHSPPVEKHDLTDKLDLEKD